MVLVLVGSYLICAQDGGSAKQTAGTKADIGYSESQPYVPRVFENTNKSKTQKNKKNTTQEPVQVSSPAAEKLSADTVITLPVSVFDTQGRFITGLQKSDFKVYANGVECSIATVETRDRPINIILLMDTSPSAYLQTNDRQTYASAIADQLRPQDKVMVVQFNLGMKVMTGLTGDREVITKAITKTKVGDGTSLYDTIQELFAEQLKSITGRRALIILTDGVDTTSKKSDYEKSLAEAEKSDVTVYPIYFDTYQQQNKNLAASLNRYPFLRGIVIGQVPGSAQAEYEIENYT